MLRYKVMLAVLLGALFAFGGSAVANAQDCGYGGCPGSTTTTAATTSTTVPEIPTITVVRGETVDVSGEGCAPGAEVATKYTACCAMKAR